MLKVIQNILSWPIFKILSPEEKLTPEEEEELIKVPLPVAHDFTGQAAESCPWLDFGDRAAALFGPPALKVYLELQQFHDYLTGSVSDDLSYIFHAEYVNKGQDLSEQACLDLGMQAPPRPLPPVIPAIPADVLATLRDYAVWYSPDGMTRIGYTYIEGFPELTIATDKAVRGAYIPFIQGYEWDSEHITAADTEFVKELRREAEA